MQALLESESLQIPQGERIRPESNALCSPLLFGTTMKEKSEKQSTKQCPQCGNTWLLKLYSLNEKWCNDCNPYVKIPWHLEEGQASVL